MEKTLLGGIQAKIRRRDYHFTLHAGDRMTERHISTREVEEAILSGGAEVIDISTNNDGSLLSPFRAN